MRLWSYYVDESYNPRTFCVGGLLAPMDNWNAIGNAWQARIDYENRKAAKKGFAPIRRYHATDCANLKRDFAEKNGWDVPRQIRFTKRLCEILTEHNPFALAVGGRIDDIRKFLPPDSKQAKELLYRASLIMNLIMVEDVMSQTAPDQQVAVYCDRSKQFGSIATVAFTESDDSGLFSELQIVSWEEHVGLQPADLIAYEGLKRIEAGMAGKTSVRKSLQMLSEADAMLIRMESFTEQNFSDLIRMAQNRQDGRPLAEGVTSKLSIVHDAT